MGSSALPKKISINAYPNPFNPTTSLNFTMPIDGMINIAIYNLNGQKLEQIAHEYKNAGSYAYTWDANLYPSGVYFAYLNFNQTVYTQKLILLK